jgi:hypothetical protein
MESLIESVSLSIDRLYIICENQNDDRHCEQLHGLLDKKGKEFSKLLLEVKERKHYAQLNNVNLTSIPAKLLFPLNVPSSPAPGLPPPVSVGLFFQMSVQSVQN